MAIDGRQNGVPTGQPWVIADRFELREVVGNGGMATVYRAWDRERRLACAVKLPADNLASDEEFRRRFRQEAEAAGALVHPRIVRLYTYEDAGPTPYMAMEHVDGGTLRDLVRRRGPLPEPLALRLAAEVAEALAYAHERGVIHRDIKPHNILLTADQHVKVADFGIARTLGDTSHTKTGSVLGSMQYISPEQARGDAAGPQSDQYSLGVVLYEALAGRLPFDEAETPVAMALKHINEPPFDLRWIRPDISEATLAVVRRLLSKSPQDRYSAAADLAAALRRIYVRFGREDGAGARAAAVAFPIGGVSSGTAVTAIVEPKTHQHGRSENAGPSPRRESVVPALARTTTLGLSLAALRRGGPHEYRAAHASTFASPRRRGSAASRAALAVIGLLGLWLFAGAVYQASRSAPGASPPPATVQQPAAQAHGAAPAGRVLVPALVGQTLDAAQHTAASQQLAVAVTSSRQDAAAGAGLVLGQEPPPNAAVAAGATIHVVISQGSGIVPDLHGLSLADAQKQLAAAGLAFGGTRHAFSDNVAAGMIVSETPGASTHLDPHAPVDLVVSDGPANNAAAPGTPAQDGPSSPPAPATGQAPAGGPSTGSTMPAAVPASATPGWPSSGVVPNVTGVPVEQAQAQLRAARLRVGQVNYTHNLDAAAGVVIYQARVAGTPISPNEPVDLLVSQGPAHPAQGAPEQTP